MVLPYKYVILHVHADIFDDLLFIYHGLSASGTLSASGADSADVLYSEGNPEAFRAEDREQDISPMACKCGRCVVLPYYYRRHNRYGICTGTSRISGDRTGTEVVPVLSL